MSYSIRSATPTDLDSVLTMLADCIATMRAAGIDQWDDVYPGEQTLRRDIENGALHVAVTEDGTIVAALVLDAYQNPEYGTVPWLFSEDRVAVVHRLMVTPRYQGRGIARAFMTFAERLARDLGYGAVRLDAFTGNPQALRLYLALGYRDAGAVIFRKGSFRCFEKRLLLAHEGSTAAEGAEA